MSDINGRLTEEVGLFLYQDWGRRLDPTQSRGWILHFGLERVGFCTKLRSDFVFWTKKVGSCTKSGSDFVFWEEKGRICKIWGSPFLGKKGLIVIHSQLFLFLSSIRKLSGIWACWKHIM